MDFSIFDLVIASRSYIHLVLHKSEYVSWSSCLDSYIFDLASDFDNREKRNSYNEAKFRLFSIIITRQEKICDVQGI